MNSPYRWHAALCLAVFLAAAAGAQAQDDPHIGYVYPAGARVGAEIEVTIGGQYLKGVSGALITGEGIEAMVVGYSKPMSRAQLAALRRRRQELRLRREAAKEALAKQQGKVKSPEASSLINTFSKELDGLDAAALAAVRRQANAKKQPNPQISETVTLNLKVARDAEPGVRELRLRTSSGVSNPLYFHVGEWQEYHETEPNDKKAYGRTPEWMPAIVNGQIMPGDIDRFRFRAAKGTRLVAAVSARSLVPYLADAVPGWFQATLTLFDGKGRELIYTDDFRFDPDPVIYFEVPETGEYVLEIKDAIYRGREDFVYRIAIGGMPFVTGIFPLGGPAGAKTTVKVYGWNLPSDELTVDARGRGAGILSVALHKGNRLTRRVPFALDTLPECLEAEPNNGQGTAQAIELPRIVNGRIDRPGDWDVFRFRGRAGQEIVAEVQARRLGSPVDSLLKLTDADGKLLAANDDHPDKGDGLTTHQADSRLGITLPADGTYLLHLGETQHKGGRAYAYRLRIGPPQPDFALRVTPCSLNASAGANVPITVHALRKDGFAGDIHLRLTDDVPGFKLSGGWIPAGQDKARLTLAVPRSGQRRPVKLELEGCAEIDGKEVCRTAVPAEDMMQAFLWRHLVPAEYWMVSVTGRRRGATPRPLDDQPVKLPAGGTARVRLWVPKGMPMNQIKIELNDPPAGIDVKKISPDGAALAVLLSADAAKVKPGLKGNLIASAVRESPIMNREGKPTGRTRRTPLGTLPAIPFEVVPPAPANPANP